jgi:hypothetical protein
MACSISLALALADLVHTFVIPLISTDDESRLMRLIMRLVIRYRLPAHLEPRLLNRLSLCTWPSHENCTSHHEPARVKQVTVKLNPLLSSAKNTRFTAIFASKRFSPPVLSLNPSSYRQVAAVRLSLKTGCDHLYTPHPKCKQNAIFFTCRASHVKLVAYEAKS